MSEFLDFLKELNSSVTETAKKYVYFCKETGAVQKITNTKDQNCDFSYLESDHDSVKKIMAGVVPVSNFKVSFDITEQKFKLENIYEEILYSVDSYLYEIPRYNSNNVVFCREYIGVHVDVWYNELAHLKGQHVWYENAVYRLTDHQEANTEFDIDNAELVIDSVKLFDDENKSLEFDRNISKGDNILRNNKIFSVHVDSTVEIKEDEDIDITDLKENLVPVYQGIHIDVWYNELAHLKGQHVWYENAVYRLTDHQEANTEFDIDNAELVIDSVKLFDDENKSLEFDRLIDHNNIILKENNLYMAKISNKHHNINKNSKKHFNADINLVQNNKYNFWSIDISKEIKKDLILNTHLVPKKLSFFITEKENPNVLLRSVELDMNSLLINNDIKIPYQNDFEYNNQEVSIYTYKILESYSHEVIE